MFIIRFAIYFTISFTVLSVPIGKNNVFFHLQKLTNPYTQNIFTIIKKPPKSQNAVVNNAANK